MNAAKIRLSPKETELVTNAEWILMKNTIMQKARQLLVDVCILQQEIMLQTRHHIPEKALQHSPKISKGENYRGLPYLVLDHPRCFDKDETLAIRTFFWWGNFFSTSIQLSGVYQEKFQKNMIAAFPKLAANDFYACINDDPWQHHFENDNYRLIKTMTKKEYEKEMKNRSFLKLSKKIPLTRWDDAANLLAADFSFITELLVD